MDSFQSPYPNDQRRFSTTELIIGVNPAKLDPPSADAASQPASVNRIRPVPSAKALVLIRQLEALAHEVALVSSGDSPNKHIKVQEGSNFSDEPQLLKPSIRVPLRDQLASYSPLFGRRTNRTLAGFSTSALDQLRRYRPAFGKLSATLAGFFTAARDWLASYRSSIDRRTFLTLAIFIATLIGVGRRTTSP
jgi:hypothetical protein